MNLATVCSNEENFIYYLRVMLYSLRNSGFNRDDNPIYIFTDGFKEGEEEQLHKLWNVKIRIVDQSLYTVNLRDPRLWSFETFNKKNYDYVIDTTNLTIREVVNKIIEKIR